MATNAVIKRRRSLVRILVSLVPEVIWKYILSQPIRIYFNKNLNLLLPTVKCDTCQLHSSPKTFGSFKSHLNRSIRTSEINLNSTPKLDITDNDSRISCLQEDLQKLKDQVAKILSQQEQLQYSHTGKVRLSDNPFVANNCKRQTDTPPPPPPPPPPLPSYLISDTQCIGPSKKKEELCKRVRPPVQGFPSGDELLRDLKRVQLKKVQKSPGGGPLKKKESFNDPGNFLEEVLKKRFSYIQNVSTDTSSDSAIDDLSNSFNSDLYHRSEFEFYKKIPTSVS